MVNIEIGWFNPILQKNAPVELREAEQALQAAENARQRSMALGGCGWSTMSGR
jgi:hypothetical protein